MASCPQQASSVGPTTVAAGPKGLPARSEGPDVLTSKWARDSTEGGGGREKRSEEPFEGRMNT